MQPRAVVAHTVLKGHTSAQPRAVFRHLSIPASHNTSIYPSYSLASRVQGALRQELLSWKALPSHERGPSPPPTLLSFTPAPTYTLGRRQAKPLSEEEHTRLQAPLHVKSEENAESKRFNPVVIPEQRGGLTTYHGPGQLVLWPVIDMRSPLHAHLSVRDYACLLEKTTIEVLEKWGITGFTTENPGVWVRSNTTESNGVERKIAALGVHLSRHVTGLGVAVNFNVPVIGPGATNPWARIVPCGLGDRGVTNICAELGREPSSREAALALQDLALTWASEFESRLKIRNDAETLVEGYDLDGWQNGIADLEIAESLEQTKNSLLP
ncbi:hypothetical protein F5Y18DRAFT_128434 [Xylariaceae sp. FL1019]|nr:hypothetical protein F5Y18DRAFT_128434 [Xylariaceae sp. FL1019]